MRMGRRRHSGGGATVGDGGGGKSLSIFKKKLLRHINSCEINHPTIDELVGYLRSTYPDYSRLKLRQFAKNVSDVLEESGSSKRPNNSSVSNDSDIDSGGYGSSSKKLMTSEERLKQMERRHLVNRSRKQAGEENNGVTSSSLDDDEEESSSSEDAIYGEEYEPKFDLMMSQLQQSYLMKSKEKALKDCEMVEVEVVNNTTSKGKVKVGLVRNGSQKVGDKLDFETKGRGGEPDNNGKGSGPKFKDLGGMDKLVEELKMEVLLPLCHPEVPESIGVKPISGILFHGPPGCGKTKLAHAIANETGLPFYMISATEVVSGVSGASEENIRNLFLKAYRTAPSIVFIDEIDAIASKRENSQREMGRRIVTQLMTCMDDLHRVGKSADGNADLEISDVKPSYVLVIGATNRPNDLDDALRRPGRFDREIALDIPDESARVSILSVFAQNLKVEGCFDLLKIARATPGFVGADLAALVNKAGNLAMKRIIEQRRIKFSGEDPDGELAEDWWRRPWLPEEVKILSITMVDFEEAVKMIQPSSKREGFSVIPNETWEDVGGLHQLREEFERYIIRRIKYPEDYEDFGVHLETGFLLYGPPGCGKTLIAKAVANAAGANFISIGGPQILNKYVGESELEVRKIFARARTCAPCIIFFDEVDSLATKRGREGGWVVERLLNQLLTELDGADQRKGVYVIGATNRPEIMDEALLRPGRFGKLVYVPLPNPDERGLILRALAKKNNRIDPNVNLMAIGKDGACENFSGADLSLLMHDAAHAALDEKQKLRESGSDITTYTIKEVHFRQALEKISPSVSKKQLQYYKRLPKILRRS